MKTCNSFQLDFYTHKCNVFLNQHKLSDRLVFLKLLIIYFQNQKSNLVCSDMHTQLTPVPRVQHKFQIMRLSMIRQFNDLFTKLYVLFVQSVTPILDQFNTFQQSEEPLVHLLHESTMKLYKGPLSCFIKTGILSKSNNVLLIDTENSESFKDRYHSHWIYHEAICCCRRYNWYPKVHQVL